MSLTPVLSKEKLLVISFKKNDFLGKIYQDEFRFVFPKPVDVPEEYVGYPVLKNVSCVPQ